MNDKELYGNISAFAEAIVRFLPIAYKEYSGSNGELIQISGSLNLELTFDKDGGEPNVYNYTVPVKGYPKHNEII